MFAIASNVGVSLTEVTVTVNSRLNDLLSVVVLRSLSDPPSVIVTVIVAVPLDPGAGVKLKLPNTSGDVYVTVGVGINVGLLLETVTCNG